MMRPVVLLLSGIILTGAARAADESTAPSLARGPLRDTRQVLALEAGDRDQLTAEMRAMLEGTQKIVQGIADNDMKMVAKVARSLGAGMAEKVEDVHAHHLPPEFIQLGDATHADFDRVAVIAERGGGAKRAAAQLSATLNRCVACHSMWRVQAAEPLPPPSSPPSSKGAPAAAHPEH
jgi:hypothetical protein